MVAEAAKRKPLIVDSSICYLCQGEKQIEDTPNKWVPCPVCKGLGKFVAFNVRYMSPALRAEFKAWCAKHEVSMSEAVVRLMEKAVDGDVELEGDLK